LEIFVRQYVPGLWRRDSQYVSYGVPVGVHGASNENDNENKESAAATVGVARAAQQLGVPATIIAKMVITPPEQIVWLLADDLRRINRKAGAGSNEFRSVKSDSDPPAISRIFYSTKIREELVRLSEGKNTDSTPRGRIDPPTRLFRLEQMGITAVQERRGNAFLQ
jgi:hypothetical protein